MAKRISPETKKAILEEFSRPGSTKAGIARKFNISSSTVSRIIATSSPKPQEKGPTESASKKEDIVDLFKKEGVTERDLKGLHSSLSEHRKSSDLNDLFSEFMNWMKERDEMEKEKLLMFAELDSLQARKKSAEKEIKDLEEKTAKLHDSIWDMKTSAERAHESMSRVEGRMELLEDRMNEDRGLLVLAAGLKSLIESGELGVKIISIISGPGGEFDPQDRRAIEKLKGALDRYIKMASAELDP